jgi:hypothetical protein
MATETIAQLAAGPTNLAGTELLEIQNGVGVGASQQTTSAKIAALANPYAAAQATTAQTNAQTYAAAQAAIAQTNAAAYTDTKVAAVPTGQVLGINSQTVAYTLVLGDKGKDVQITSATAVNLTIPLNSSVAFPLGTLIAITQMGAGAVTIVGISGVTVEGGFGVATTAQYDGRVIEQIATNVWRVW